MIVTMVLMGFASLGLRLLPTYKTIGVWAPMLMLSLRLLQGLAIGGELPSMIVYVSESMPKQRGLAMGGVFAGTVGGLLPGMLINLLITHYLTPQQIHDFGWRIPFLLGSLLCIIGYQVRNRLHETTAFISIKERVKFPLGVLIKNHFSKIVIGTGLVSAMATPILLAIIFMPTYLTKILNFQSDMISGTILIATILSVLSTYIVGFLTQRYSPFILMKTGLLMLVLAAAICYSMLALRWNVMIALSIFAIFQGALVGLPPIFLSYLFPVEIRLSGVALSYNIAFVVFGGLTPIVITTMIGCTNLLYLVPFIGLSVVALVASLSLALCRKFIPDIPLTASMES